MQSASSVELRTKRKNTHTQREREEKKRGDVRDNAVSRVTRGGRIGFLASRRVRRNGADAKARHGNRWTRARRFSHGRRTDINSQQLSPSPPAKLPLLPRIRAKERLPFDSPLINFASRRTRERERERAGFLLSLPLPVFPQPVRPLARRRRGRRQRGQFFRQLSY